MELPLPNSWRTSFSEVKNHGGYWCSFYERINLCSEEPKVPKRHHRDFVSLIVLVGAGLFIRSELVYDRRKQEEDLRVRESEASERERQQKFKERNKGDFRVEGLVSGLDGKSDAGTSTER
ncbi:MAG TPA: hypothetical protein VHM91_15010 [Verrucomicrobiales bacterium]|nr:hypothetical protein [Verrucomicrobiales bacterium]